MNIIGIGDAVVAWILSTVFLTLLLGVEDSYGRVLGGQ